MNRRNFLKTTAAFAALPIVKPEAALLTVAEYLKDYKWCYRTDNRYVQDADGQFLPIPQVTEQLVTDGERCGCHLNEKILWKWNANTDWLEAPYEEIIYIHKSLLSDADTFRAHIDRVRSLISNWTYVNDKRVIRVIEKRQEPKLLIFESCCPPRNTTP